MKKILTIIGICIATLVLVITILPYALEGKVASIVKSEGNKMLNAQFDFEELDISLFRHFPSATVSLEDFWLKGIGAFENDTLAKADELSATINLFSLFGNGGYKISKILLDKVRFHAIVLEDGTVNWDIVRPSENAEQEDIPENNEPTPFRIQLENLSIKDFTVVYDDRKAGMYAAVQDLGANCSGDFGSEQTLLKVKAETPSVTIQTNGVAFLNQANVAMQMDIDANFKEQVFTLKDNTLSLNAIQTRLDGSLKKIDEGCDVDLRLASNEVSFKEILSLIPGIYTEEFKELKTDGKVELTAYTQGILKGDSIVPKFEVALHVKDGLFRYPSLPGGVDHINVAVALKNPGGHPDATILDIHPFEFVMNGQPFSAMAHLKNPVSDLDFKLEAKGKINLGKIKDVYPMKDMNLKGMIDADMRLAGKLSAVEKEQFDQIQADGQLRLNDMELTLADLPKIQIQQSLFSFSPKVLKLSETTVKMGVNDLTFDSQFENYLAFAFKGKTLKGSLNVRSSYLNLSDFMMNEASDSTTAVKDVKDVKGENSTQTKKSGLIIPANIDFRMQTNLKTVVLDKMKFEKINGLLLVKDQTVDMSNLSLHTMGGKVIANGAYATPKGQRASLNGSFALQKLDFGRTYTELDMVKQLAPIFAGLKGNYSGSIQLDAYLDEQLSVDLSSVQGKGNLSTSNLSLSGVKFIDQVADIVKKPELKNIEVDKLNLDFTIDKGRVTTQPFDLKLGEYNMNLSGSTGLDQTIDYRGKITMPFSYKGKKRYGTVDMLIKGTFDKPEVSIDMASLAKNIAVQVFESLGNDNDAADSLKPKKNILDKALDLFKKKK